MEDLEDVIVIMGISHTQLFNGTAGIELILLDPSTGADFTVPITEEQADLILSHKFGGQNGAPEGLRPNPTAPNKDADQIRAPDEIDQF